MSASHENLPAVEDKPPSLPEVVWAAARWLAKRELLIRLGIVALLVVTGGATVVYGQDYLDGGVAKVRADVVRKDEATNRRIDALERKFDSSEERSARRFEVLYNTMLTGRPQPGAAELMKSGDGGR